MKGPINSGLPFIQPYLVLILGLGGVWPGGTVGLYDNRAPLQASCSFWECSQPPKTRQSCCRSLAGILRELALQRRRPAWKEARPGSGGVIVLLVLAGSRLREWRLGAYASPGVSVLGAHAPFCENLLSRRVAGCSQQIPHLECLLGTVSARAVGGAAALFVHLLLPAKQVETSLLFYAGVRQTWNENSEVLGSDSLPQDSGRPDNGSWGLVGLNSERAASERNRASVGLVCC